MGVTRMKISIILVSLLVLFSATTHALSLERCFSLASRTYGIPVDLLKAIAKTETGFNPYAINYNNNKSYDMGIMQINSYWLPKLSKIGITQADLFDGCKNIQVGAWILSSNIKQYGFNRKAIGAYNAVSPDKQEIYARKVLSNLSN